MNNVKTTKVEISCTIWKNENRTGLIYTKFHENNMFFTCLSSSRKKNGFFIIHEDVWKKTITATQLVITDMLRTETCETRVSKEQKIYLLFSLPG